MNIIVTGGAGFIGSNFVFHMLNTYPDYRIICVDKLTYAGNLSTLEPVMDNPNFRFCKIDICDRDAIYGLFEEEHPDMVVNFAAESHVDRSIENPEVFLNTNILGTAVLMDACRKYGIKRYHQVSTDEVYGDLPLDRPDLFFTEETPIHTSSPYSSSKAGADLLVLAYHRTYGLPVTISRCSNNYGPYHFPEKLIPLMISNALNDKPLPVYGKGENIRDWLYVEDHCRAIDLIIHKGRVGEVYNVGGHNEMKNIDIVKIICKELGKPESLITYVADRKGHDMRYAIDPTKIHNELGWLPETKFADGIKKTIKWYLDNKEWWETIISGEYQNYYEKMCGNRQQYSNMLRQNSYPYERFTMDKANDIITNIIKEVLTALYQPFGAAVLMAFVSMFVFLYAREHGWKKGSLIKNIFGTWFRNFKESSTFRRAFLLVFYSTMILFRTILNRDIWFDPLGDIMGNWGLHNADGTLSTESIENFMLFMPFAVLLLWAFKDEILGSDVRLGKVLWKSTVAVGIFSFGIEFSQLLFHLGTLQISDLVYNTLGGTVGGAVYYVIYRVRHKGE